MKRALFSLILTASLLANTVEAQEFKATDPKVSSPAYFDKTPPLRDMKIVAVGERDRSWKDKVIGNEHRDESHLYSNKEAVPVDHVQQHEKGTRPTEGPIYNFSGTPRIGGYTPPDPHGDVGPNHYFQMVNVSFSIYDKQGNLLYGPVDNSTLWNGFIGPWTGTNDGDPIVVYDDFADRWIATQFAVNTSNNSYWQLVAVSETSDPLGAYYRYAYEFTPLFNDYPKFSVWPDGYYSTYNMFQGGYAGNVSAVMDRDEMLVGNPDAQMIEFGPFGPQYGVKSAHLDGTTLPPTDSPNWHVNLRKYGSQALEIYKFETDWNVPANSSYTLYNTLTITPFDFFDPSVRPQLPQPNTTQLLDPLSKYLMNPLQYRNFGAYEAMVVNHTVKLGARAGVRWYEIRRDSAQASWYLYQEGTYAPNDQESRWMASIAMNAAGDIALAYSVTGDTTFPSIRYTGRSASSPLGVMDVEEVTLVEGSGYQSGLARWGDYSAMSVDPNDDSTFWYTGEYMPGSAWGTQISSFDLGPIQAPTADAGEDSEICSQEAFYAQGSATSAQSVLWVSLGDGTLINDNSLTPGYVRGNGDLAAGYFELVLTAYGYEPGMEASDTVHVDILFDTDINLGDDTLICMNYTLQLNPEYSNVDSVRWFTNGDGTYNNDTIINPLYTPGPEDIANGEVTLSVYAAAFEPCEGEAEDELIVTIDACTGIEEQQAGGLALDVYPNPSNGIFNIEVTSETQTEFILKVIDLKGQHIFSGSMNITNNTYKNAIDLSYLPRGVYYVIITNGISSSARKIIFE